VNKNREITAKLYNCSIASNTKDVTINKLYSEIKLLEKRHKSNVTETELLIETNNSRFQICRKSLLDCKVSNSNLSEYNRKLIENQNNY
jgi:hypothetical protein